MQLVNKHHELNSAVKNFTSDDQMPDRMPNEVNEIIGAGEANQFLSEIFEKMFNYSAEQIEADQLLFTKNDFLCN